MNKEGNSILVDIHDRVTEAYYGKLGDIMMQQTQKRIHWICNNVSGKRILDVGCSQGILPILLGREGKSAIGLDSSQNAIDQANDALSKEEQDVRENTSFLRANFLLYDFSDEKYDSIIIAEVLEHLVNPQDFIEKAKDLLTDDGCLIVTVPFGINDFIDHKKTYYVHDLYQMLHKYFDITDVSILDKWIGFVTKKRPKSIVETLDSVNIQLVKKVEESFYSIERKLVENNKEQIEKNKRLHTNLSAANSKYREATTHIELQKKELAKAAIDITAQKNKLKEASIQSTVQKSELEKSTTEITAQKDKLKEALALTAIQQKELEKATTEITTQKDKHKEVLSLTALQQNELEKVATEITAQKNKLKKTSTQTAVQKNELEKTQLIIEDYRTSVSFQLGYLLTHNLRSIGDILRLPSEIYKIRKKYQIRKKKLNKNTQSITGNSPPKPEQTHTVTKVQKTYIDTLTSIWRNKGPKQATGYIQSSRLSSYHLADLYEVLAGLEKPSLQGNFYLQAYLEDPSYNRAIKMFRRIGDAGLLLTAKKILDNFEQKQYDINPADLKDLNYVRGYVSLYKQLPKIPKTPTQKVAPLQKNTHNVLMFLHASLPHHSNGYATRSHAILTTLLKSSKYSVKGITRSGYPSDIGIKTLSNDDVVDGVHYERLNAAHYYNQPIDHYMLTAANEIEQRLISERPSIVHSASAFYTALPALIAARRLGITFIYEVRGLWEITRASTIPGWGETERFELESNLETLVANQADQVIVITKGLKDELVLRGVSEDQITVIPNAINKEHFKPHAPNLTLKKEIGLKDIPTIGYVGSIVAYEGIEDLVGALALLKQGGIPFNFLLIGDGNALAGVREKVSLLNLEAEVFILGRIPHNKVQEYYSLIDITPFPRQSLQVCEMVSPLKPFEAMAQRKTVIASNVGALQEIIQDKKTGLLFEKGNIQDLFEKLKQVLTDKNLCNKLAEEGNKWVLKNRDWSQIAPRFDIVYDNAFAVNQQNLSLKIAEAKTIHPLSFLVYGDVNLNYVDGSAVWASSLVEMLAGLQNTSITFLLKADLTHDTLIESIKKLDNVTIISPYRDCRESKVLQPDDAVSLLEEMQSRHHYDAIILRGFEINRRAALKDIFQGRIWAYIVDIFQQKDSWDDKIIDDITHVVKASYTVFCQTTHIQEFLEHNIPIARGKTTLLPPMVPDQIGLKKKFNINNRAFKIIYAGKFAPLWGTREMLSTFKGLREKGNNVELHIYGDKIHNPPEDPLFKSEVEAALAQTEGLVWHKAKPRHEVIAAMRTYDLAWAWRQPELEGNTEEVSTKFLEYASAGLPMLVVANKITIKLLSDQYPLFINSYDALIPTIETAINNTEMIKQASSIVYEASKAFSFSFVRTKYIEQLVAPLYLYKEKKTILFVGHDLKFIDKLMEKFANCGYTVLVDKWQDHNKHNETKSLELLGQADIIFCEWCLGNAVWYSQNKLPHQKLFVRFHRQEIDTNYPSQVNYETIDSMVFIAPHIQQNTINKFTLGKYQDKFAYMPNYVHTNELDLYKIENARFNLGIVGIVPQMKRFDLALDIFEGLRRKDKRYQLYVKGKQAKEYPWMHKRAGELKFYLEQEKRIENSPYLKGAVHYDDFGKDMGDWFTKIGYILSTSDFEGSHLSVAEAMASGSTPVIITWDGADAIYPENCCFNNISNATEFILSETDNSFASRLVQNKDFVKKFDIEVVMHNWLNVMNNCKFH